MFIKALLIIGFMYIFIQPSLGQGICSDREKIIKYLEMRYKEYPILQGLTLRGNVMELLTAQDKSSWTVIITFPSKESCVAEAGIDLEIGSSIKE